MTTSPAPSINVILPTGTSVGPWNTGWTYAEPADVWIYVMSGEVRGPDLALGVDFILSGATPLETGGEVTLEPHVVPVGGWVSVGPGQHRLVIRRRTARRQSTALPDVEGHKPRATERALDRAMRIAQELTDQQGLALTVEPGQTAPNAEEIRAAANAAEAATAAQAAAEAAAQAAEDLANSLGGINKGGWDAALNEPEIVSGEGRGGDFYTVAIAGTTEIDEEDDWAVGDQIIFKDGAWTKFKSVTSSVLFTTLEEHGGKANDPDFDNAVAIAAAEAWIEARMVAEPGLRGVLQFRGCVDYYFKNTIGMKRTGGVWQGNRTRLIYNGTSTTRDLVAFGHYNGGESLTGKPQTRDVWIDGFQIMSATKMTAGWAVRTRSCIESNFNFELQTQHGYYALGHNLWNGVWNEWSSTVRYVATTWVAQNVVAAVNGAPGLDGGKSDIWIDVGKIAGGLLGLHIGGGFGGIWCATGTTFISNKKHVLINQGLTPENNREVMFKGTTFDYTAVNNGTQPGDVGIDVADASEVFIDITDCWIAGAHGAHMIVRAASSAFINCSGNRWFYGKAHPTDGDLLGHAIVTDSATARIFVDGGQANAFPGIVFRSRVANHNLNFADVHVWNSPAGVYDVNFVSTVDTTFRAVSGATWTRSGWFDNNVLIGPSVDQNFYLRRSGVNPIVNFDTDDYLEYNKAANRLDVSIAGNKPLRVSSGGVSFSADSPFLYPIFVEGTTDGSGNAGGALLVPQARVMSSFILVEGGAVGGFSRSIQIQANGSSWQAIGDANSANKPFHGLIWLRLP